MHIQDLSSSQNSNKWQDMLAIINQRPELIQNNLARQNKKIFLTRLITENIFIFLLQYTGLMFSTISSGMHPVWIASGTACAFIFLRGISITPGIWLGSIFAFYSVLPIGEACVFASIFTLQPLIILAITFRYLKSPMPDFYNTRSFINFIFACAITTASTSLLLAITINITQLWPHWWLANFNGTLIFTCAIITWDAYFSEQKSLSIINNMIIGIAFGLLITLIVIMCISHSTLITTLVSIAIFVLILSISNYVGWCASIISITLLAIIISISAYVITSANQTSNTTLMLELLMTISTITSLLIGIKSSNSSQTNL